MLQFLWWLQKGVSPSSCSNLHGCPVNKANETMFSLLQAGNKVLSGSPLKPSWCFFCLNDSVLSGLTNQKVQSLEWKEVKSSQCTKRL